MRSAVRHLEFATAASVLVLAALAQAQSSTNTVTYQGVLTQSGAPVADGTYTLELEPS